MVFRGSVSSDFDPIGFKSMEGQAKLSEKSQKFDKLMIIEEGKQKHLNFIKLISCRGGI